MRLVEEVDYLMAPGFWQKGKASGICGTRQKAKVKRILQGISSFGVLMGSGFNLPLWVLSLCEGFI